MTWGVSLAVSNHARRLETSPISLLSSGRSILRPSLQWSGVRVSAVMPETGISILAVNLGSCWPRMRQQLEWVGATQALTQVLL